MVSRNCHPQAPENFNLSYQPSKSSDVPLSAEQIDDQKMTCIHIYICIYIYILYTYVCVNKYIQTYIHQLCKMIYQLFLATVPPIKPSNYQPQSLRRKGPIRPEEHQAQEQHSPRTSHGLSWNEKTCRIPTIQRGSVAISRDKYGDGNDGFDCGLGYTPLPSWPFVLCENEDSPKGLGTLFRTNHDIIPYPHP